MLQLIKKFNVKTNELDKVIKVSALKVNFLEIFKNTIE